MLTSSPIPTLPLVDARADRLSRTTVCTRPFRAAGPRIEAERLSDKIVVHNYGHGGAGWSLSWGSALIAMERAAAAAGHDFQGRTVAVIGCGAAGLTLAVSLQKAGAAVTLYAKDGPQQSRSFRATGSWTPDSRIALTSAMAPDFPALWDRMARTSWHTYQTFHARPGVPVEFLDQYQIGDIPPDEQDSLTASSDALGFVKLRGSLRDLTPPFNDLPPGTHPFATRFVRQNSQLTFNITALVQTLTEDFLLAGGQLVTREFHTPADFTTLPQTLIFNCTGYAARALFHDDSLTPVRGQIAWLPPQPEVHYGFVHGGLRMLSRRDGIVVQLSAQNDATGWQDATETVDPHEAEEGLRQLQAIQAGMRAVSS